MLTSRRARWSTTGESASLRQLSALAKRWPLTPRIGVDQVRRAAPTAAFHSDPGGDL